MRTRNLAGAAPIAALLLWGCCTMAPPRTQLADDAALVAPHVTFVIPPPQSLDETVNVAQAVVAHYRDRSFSFDTQLQITPAELDFAALDGMGRRALTVTWKSAGIQYQQAPWLPPALRAADILADIAIVYWPEKALAAALSGTGAELATTDGTRKISADGRDLIVVEYGKGEGWNRAARLRNLAFGYEIDIQSAEIAP